MRIKDLATMAGNCRHMRLINTRTEDGKIVRQHLELNGRAIYPLDGLQPIEPETLLTIADVEKEIREKYEVTQANMSEFLARYTDDSREGDIPLKRAKISLKSKLFELISLMPEGGGDAVFLPLAVLKPIKDAEIDFVLRRIDDDINVIVAMEGFVNIGAFAPAELWADRDEAAELRSMWLSAVKLADKNETRRLEDGR